MVTVCVCVRARGHGSAWGWASCQCVWLPWPVHSPLAYSPLAIAALAYARTRHAALQDRWNGDPHDLDGGSGMSEDDPSDWLLPYWLARYYGLIV